MYPRRFAVILLLLTLAACAKNLDVQLPESKPETKVTAYSDALRRFGLMTQMFQTSELFVTVERFQDDTGTAQASQGDIPLDVTEMVNSAVNRIGGSIRPVAYKAQYMANQLQLGFTNKSTLKQPDLLIAGGITEYDRALEVKGDKINAGSSIGPKASIDASMDKKESTSSIAIDMNMIDAKSMAMIPQVQASNQVKVYKAANEAELGFSILGASFGISGSVKKIQGKHAAVRLLIEMSVLEILGKTMGLPYWKCVGEGANVDPVVMDKLRGLYAAWTGPEKVKALQRMLTLYGFQGVEATGEVDAPTKAALKIYQSAYGVTSNRLDEEFYGNLVNNMPLFGEPNKIAQASLDVGGSAAATPAAADPQAGQDRLNKFLKK